MVQTQEMDVNQRGHRPEESVLAHQSSHSTSSGHQPAALMATSNTAIAYHFHRRLRHRVKSTQIVSYIQEAHQEEFASLQYAITTHALHEQNDTANEESTVGEVGLLVVTSCGRRLARLVSSNAGGCSLHLHHWRMTARCICASAFPAASIRLRDQYQL